MRHAESYLLKMTLCAQHVTSSSCMIRSLKETLVQLQRSFCAIRLCQATAAFGFSSECRGQFAFVGPPDAWHVVLRRVIKVLARNILGNNSSQGSHSSQCRWEIKGKGWVVESIALARRCDSSMVGYLLVVCRWGWLLSGSFRWKDFLVADMPNKIFTTPVVVTIPNWWRMTHLGVMSGAGIGRSRCFRTSSRRA